MIFSNVPVIEGTVSVDYDRAERRTFDMTIDGTGINVGPGGLWYDTVISLARSVTVSASDLAAATPTELALLNSVNNHSYSLGVFLIDTIEQSHFPNVIHLTGRDYTKKLMLKKFATPQTFTLSPEQLDPTGFTYIEIMLGLFQFFGGIYIAGTSNPTPNILPSFAFEAGTSYYTALKEISDSQGYSFWFDVSGHAQAAPFIDPTTASPIFSFHTGTGSNLASYTKQTNDAEIFNHVVVTGMTDLREPVWGEARNDNPASPTYIGGPLGDRMTFFDSPLITSNAAAAQLASDMLKISALESFEINMGTLVLPWLDVGQVVEFIPTDPDPGDPTNFLVTHIDIPLGLGTMNVTAKRITVVG